MKKFRIISVLFLISVLAIFTGCLGGGGSSSAPVEKDVAGITSTLNGYVGSLRANDTAAASQYFASTAGSPTSGSVQTLLIKDFGANISNANDNATWSFLIYPQDILQPTPEIAFVKATYVMHSGSPIIISFSLIKENGSWVIENMELVTQLASGTNTSVPGSFITRTFFPVKSGINSNYALLDSSSTPLSDRLIQSFSSASTDNGISFYKLNESISSPGSTSYDGAPINSNIRSARQSIRGSSSPFFYNASSIFFGLDSSGALWIKTPESNSGAPLKLLDASYAYGTSVNMDISWYESSLGAQTGSLTINIGQPLSLQTPLKTFSAVSLTFLTTWNNGLNKHKWVLYLAPDVGIVGSDHYSIATSVAPFRQERMLTRFSTDLLLNERNDPRISTLAALGDFNVGSQVSIQLAASGGTAPYKYSVSPSYGLLEGLTLNTNGTLSGTIAGSPALGSYNTRIIVTDLYGRNSYKDFTVNVVAVSQPVTNVVTYSPVIPGTLAVGASHKAWVMLNGSSVKLDEYIFELINKSPYMGFVNIGSDASGYLTVNVTGDSATTLHFTGRLTRRSDSTVSTSAVVTVVVTPATTSPVTFSPVLGSIINNQTLESSILVNGSPILHSDYTYSIIEVSPAMAESYITIYSQGGYAKLSLWGYQAGQTVSFRLAVRNNSTSVSYTSAVQTVTINSF